ncbi:hypothetical protein FH608_045940 [Nonomuraea phyllanthi]|uniref:Uncharacterized protein n=1 Tax=Nonomuraea phyllanthi TaxID=2219224 RepID=A0A5C4V5S4_9ACTN|nr:hypothetical protein [Nonomuraea phyllanthi]KAB8186839.1 hypothetical protein FH608_045940 [Nonomuraea phyllanthi]
MSAALAESAEEIADRLHDRDLDGARKLFDTLAVDDATVSRLVRQLAKTVTILAGMVVWGYALDVWANPRRDVDERAWRCGGCRMTASHYTTDRAATASAGKHVAEHHGGRLAVVSYLAEAYWDAVEAAEYGR